MNDWAFLIACILCLTYCSVKEDTMELEKLKADYKICLYKIKGDE